MVFCTGLLVAATCAVFAQAPATLDVREKVPPAAAAPPAMASPTPLSRGAALRTNPLQITLIALDRATYRLGESLVFNVLVRNTGSTTVSLPWEPDWRRLVSARQEDVYTCTIGLELRDSGDTAGAVLPPLRLYASKAMPSTERQLVPGAAVQIVAPATWRLDASHTSRRFLALLPATTAVRVVLAFERQPDPAHPWAPARSMTNAWVRLTRDGPRLR